MTQLVEEEYNNNIQFSSMGSTNGSSLHLKTPDVNLSDDVDIERQDDVLEALNTLSNRLKVSQDILKFKSAATLQSETERCKVLEECQRNLH